MDRAAWDRLTTDQLREEAQKYQLQDSVDRRTLIDLLMAHFERHAPIDFGPHARKSTRTVPTTARATQEAEADESITASTMKQVMMAVSEDILRQRELQN